MLERQATDYVHRHSDAVEEPPIPANGEAPTNPIGPRLHHSQTAPMSSEQKTTHTAARESTLLSSHPGAPTSAGRPEPLNRPEAS